MFCEVPLFYPSLSKRRRRYLVKDGEIVAAFGSDVFIDPDGEEEEVDETLTGTGVVEALVGSASVCRLPSRSRGFDGIDGIDGIDDDDGYDDDDEKNAESVVITCGISGQPGVIAVVLMEASVHRTIELDFGSSTTTKNTGHLADPPVKIKCFEEENERTGSDRSRRVHLLMADSRANVMGLCLDRETWTPIALFDDDDDGNVNGGFLRTVSVSDLLGSRYAGSEVHSSMVDFLSPTFAVMAVSPYMLSVDLASRKISPWSEEGCKRNRAQGSVGISMLSLFGAASSADQEGSDEMKAVSALTTIPFAHDSGPSVPSHAVFTLHSDGAFKKWTLTFASRSNISINTGPSSPNPTSIPIPSSVQPLDLELPSHNWSIQTHNSISLRSQIYTSNTCVVAVHIQTRDVSTRMSGGIAKTTPFLGIATCPVHDDVRTGETSFVRLKVPDDADYLLDMSLNHPPGRCQLVALFRRSLASEGEGVSTTLFATYPHSFNAIVSTHPIVESEEHTLDATAVREYHRIPQICCTPLYGMAQTQSTKALDEALHKLDSQYLKHLFRPIHPRGTGTIVGPSETVVRSAVSKLVRGYSCRKDRSIELETLRAMHEWRRSENRAIRRSQQQIQATPIRQIGTTIYDTFASPETAVVARETDTDEEMMTDEHEQAENARMDQIEAHENRWLTLLRAIWSEEEILRTPLLLSTVAPSKTILIRADVVSTLVESQPVPSTTIADNLDKMAITLLKTIGDYDHKQIELQMIERAMLQLVVDALPLLREGNARQFGKQNFGALGLWAIRNSQSRTMEAISPSISSIREGFRALSGTEISTWLSKFPSQSWLPGLERMCLEGIRPLQDVPSTSISIAGPDVRHAACSLVVKSADSKRALSLGRCLLIFGAEEVDAKLANSLLYPYFHSLAVLWASAQRVDIPVIPVSTILGRGNDSPTLRSSFGASNITIESILPTTSKTTVLDVHIIQISQSGIDNGASIAATMILARQVIASIAGNAESGGELSSGSPYNILQEEIGVLPKPSNLAAIATDYPTIALRLLVPRVHLSQGETGDPLTSPEHALSTLRSTVAECLLIAASGKATSESVKQSMWKTACAMLVDHSMPDFDQSAIEVAHQYLQGINDMASKESSLPDNSDAVRRMQQAVQALLRLPAGFILDEVDRLSQLATARALLLPLLSAGTSKFLQIEGYMQENVIVLIHSLLRVSRLSKKLELLDRHTDYLGRLSSVDEANILLKNTKATIQDIESFLPKSLYSSMPEYSAMWTRLLRYAEAAGQWGVAFQACLSYPATEHRAIRLQRTVEAMVKAGCMDQLLHMCLSSSVSNLGSINLYEIASEALLANSVNKYLVAENITADSLGCLYSLHSSALDWKRAAQALDLRYCDARAAIERFGGEPGFDPKVAVLDVELSALGSAITMSLVDDPGSEFLISNGFSGIPALPTVAKQEEGAAESVLKRGRNQELRDQSERCEEDTEDRLSRFLTTVELRERLAHSVGLRTLIDTGVSAPRDLSILEESVSDAAKHNFLHDLGSQGYFREMLLVAKAMSHSQERRGKATKLAGSEIESDVLSLIVCSFVVPGILGISELNSDSGVPMEDASAPNYSLSQLHYAVDELSGTPETISFTCGPKWKVRDGVPLVGTSAAAMELLRRVIVGRSNATNRLGMKICQRFLDLATCRARLPLWLESFMMGEGKPGLFASTMKSHTGRDPCALLHLYMKAGMYAEACDVVSTLLVGGVNGIMREVGSSARLPERGNIDFVPYNKIDQLWELTALVMDSVSVSTTERQNLAVSRSRLEAALEKHFELMNISEMGLQSARSLSAIM